jgi:hypothetical protein
MDVDQIDPASLGHHTREMTGYLANVQVEIAETASERVAAARDEDLIETASRELANE